MACQSVTLQKNRTTLFGQQFHLYLWIIDYGDQEGCHITKKSLEYLNSSKATMLVGTFHVLQTPGAFT